MQELAPFAKIAPYLKDPLVLVGFGLYLFVGLVRIIITTKVSPLSQRQSAAVVRMVIKYGSLLAAACVILGFVHTFQTSKATSKVQGPIIQQSGPCSSNTVGDNNQTSVDCSHTGEGTEHK